MEIELDSRKQDYRVQRVGLKKKKDSAEDFSNGLPAEGGSSSSGPPHSSALVGARRVPASTVIANAMKMISGSSSQISLDVITLEPALVCVRACVRVRVRVSERGGRAAFLSSKV